MMDERERDDNKLIESLPQVVTDLWNFIAVDGQIAVVEELIAACGPARHYESGHGDDWGNHKLIDERCEKLKTIRAALIRRRADRLTNYRWGVNGGLPSGRTTDGEAKLTPSGVAFDITKAYCDALTFTQVLDVFVLSRKDYNAKKVVRVIVDGYNDLIAVRTECDVIEAEQDEKRSKSRG